MELYRKSASQLAAMLRSKEVSAVEIARETLARIEAAEPAVDAFLSVNAEAALTQAAEVDRKLAAGEAVGALAGIPVAVKDNICTKGTATTCASKILEHFAPPYNATVVEKLLAADAILPGKVNMDEFAMGGSCENSAFKATKNPWDTTRVPGGSSGGSAASVAACEVPLSLGSDTGGSVRCPAGLCGIVGLKPTYGAVSRFGLVAFASSLDQIGPMARTVDDAALLFSVICGQDAAHDATSKPYAFSGIEEMRDCKGLRIGVPAEYFGEGVSDEVKAAVRKAVDDYRAMGAEIVELSLPSTPYALSAYYIISSAEASSNLARYDGVKYGYSGRRDGSLNDLYLTTRSEGFGKEVKRRIMLGTYVLSSGYYDAYYKRAKMLQRMIAREFSDAFERCDIIVTPTTPATAFGLGEKLGDPLAMYASDICTTTVNIAGLPALSVPCGFDAAGLPIGMQLIGPKWSEAKLLGAAKCYETAKGGFAVKEM
ncbi:MAG TPA: Asp-tRNA(Asn)/Glu-tRNA(Gln) amidotransferase subunit GatA [Candidatus Ruthenibacterium merdigallinarum]|nr:Asp-tRNA(Asn)/Glu-tRNA(Gln) amidotransferase subunit GatA [Candidatus Ruthenibacterium merdigallinarum]